MFFVSESLDCSVHRLNATYSLSGHDNAVDVSAGQKSLRSDGCFLSLTISDFIFVTNITNYICGEKTVMWRNFSFLYRIWTIYGVLSKFMLFLFRLYVEKNLCGKNLCGEKMTFDIFRPRRPFDVGRSGRAHKRHGKVLIPREMQHSVEPLWEIGKCINMTVARIVHIRDDQRRVRPKSN